MLSGSKDIEAYFFGLLCNGHGSFDAFVFGRGFTGGRIGGYVAYCENSKLHDVLQKLMHLHDLMGITARRPKQFPSRL